nr:Gag-Pol polyprotein [Tanacetum cinerariifolium]
MINCIKNGDQPLPRVTQVSIAGTSSTEQPPLKDKSMWYDQEKKMKKIDRLARSLLIQDEASEVIISFIKKTQVNLQLYVQRVRTDNGTEFKNKTLAKFFNEVGILNNFMLQERHNKMVLWKGEIKHWSRLQEQTSSLKPYVSTVILEKIIIDLEDEVVQKRLEKANQQCNNFENQNKDLKDKYDVLKNQATTFEEKNNELNEQIKVLIEKNADLLAQTNVLQEQLKVKHVVIDTHAECQEKYVKLEAEIYEYMIRYSAYFDNENSIGNKLLIKIFCLIK